MGYQEVQDTRKYETSWSARYQKVRDTKTREISETARYQEVRDTRMCEIPGSTRYQEIRQVRNTRKKCEIRGTTGHGKAKYQLPLSTRYQEVRIQGSTRYHNARNISGWTTYQEVTGKIRWKLSLLGCFGIVIMCDYKLRIAIRSLINH